MNILAKTFEGHVVFRPDTTWERDNENLYPPEFVKTLTFSPVIFAHVLKPGRRVERRFAPRYYDGIGFGILLYPENLISPDPESYAEALCMDRISYLPTPFSDPEIITEASAFKVYKNGAEICRIDPPSLDILEEAFVDASRLAYIRTGDIVAVELAARKTLMQSDEGRVLITSDWVEGASDLNFSIIF